MDAAHGIEYSTVVTTMARNGYEFGLRISGLPGQWFTGPSQQVIGPMFAGYKPEDSGLDIGDRNHRNLRYWRFCYGNSASYCGTRWRYGRRSGRFLSPNA